MFWSYWKNLLDFLSFKIATFQFMMKKSKGNKIALLIIPTSGHKAIPTCIQPHQGDATCSRVFTHSRQEHSISSTTLRPPGDSSLKMMKTQRMK